MGSGIHIKPQWNVFGFYTGGLIQLNHGRPQPLQYVVYAAYLATVFSDYLDAANTPGWRCGHNFHSTDLLREFAKSQVLNRFDSVILKDTPIIHHTSFNNPTMSSERMSCFVLCISVCSS